LRALGRRLSSPGRDRASRDPDAAPIRDRLHPEEWLLIEWPTGEAAPAKFWLANVAVDTTITDLVNLVKLRWRIERDYQEFKDEIGLDHYEGRNWPGFHHHAALCMAAYAFLVAERARLYPRRLWPSSKPLLYPEVSAQGEVPPRPERHDPTSIATLRRIIARILAAQLCVCHVCGASRAI
jgi:hypothetical protein